MTGKEALIILSECANGDKKLLFSDSLYLERIISKRLEKLEKLERAFEILKHEFNLNFEEDEYFCNKKYFLRSDTNIQLEKEEYELLEELMKDA